MLVPIERANSGRRLPPKRSTTSSRMISSSFGPTLIYTVLSAVLATSRTGSAGVGAASGAGADGFSTTGAAPAAGAGGPSTTGAAGECGGRSTVPVGAAPGTAGVPGTAAGSP